MVIFCNYLFIFSFQKRQNAGLYLSWSKIMILTLPTSNLHPSYFQIFSSFLPSLLYFILFVNTHGLNSHNSSQENFHAFCTLRHLSLPFSSWSLVCVCTPRWLNKMLEHVRFVGEAVWRVSFLKSAQKSIVFQRDLHIYIYCTKWHRVDVKS